MKNAVLLLICLILPGILGGTNRVYEEKTGNQLTTHRFVIEPTGTGYSIDLQSETGETGGAVITQTFNLDNNLAAISWTYEYPKENTKITAARIDNKILLEGRDKGKPIRKTFNIKEFPWNQSFNLGLERFVLSPGKTMLFWAIGTKGPGNMKITKFKAKKQGIETISIGGREVEAVHVTISLTGLLSMFWTGNYWYRKSDGRFLRYKGKSGPGSGISIMELISDQGDSFRENRPPGPPTKAFDKDNKNFR